MSRQKLIKSKIFTFKFYTRLFLSIATVYIGVAIGFAALMPYNYQRRRQNFLLTAATVLLQPAMELVGNGKVTHFYDYKTIDKSTISTNILPLKLIPSKPQIRKLDNSINSIFSNAFAHTVLIQEAAIITPINYSGKWSLVFCQNMSAGSSEEECQTSKIKHTGQVKILVDGSGSIWGFTEDEKWIELKLVEYLDKNQRQDILFI